MADDKEFVSMLNVEEDTSELLGFNPEADANASIPPFPAGKYFANFSFTEEDPEKRWVKAIWGKGANEQTVYYTSITATLYGTPNGDYDGRQVRDGLISTFVSKHNGTCSVQGLLQCIGVEIPPSTKTRSQLLKLFNDSVAAGASGQIETDWEAQEKLTEEEREALKAAGKKPFRIQGMKRFSADAEGNYIPVYNYNGVDCRAFNVITRYITVASVDSAPEVQEQAPVAPPTPKLAPRQAPRPAAPTTAPAASAPPVPQRQAPRAPVAPRRTA